MQDTAAAHGNPLGADEVAKVKEILGLPQEDFFVPDDVRLWYREAGTRGAPVRDAWDARPKPDEYEACLTGAGLHGWEQKLPTWQAGASLADPRRDRRGADRRRRCRPRVVHRVG